MRTYDVIVVGGGVVGTSVLYHLSQYRREIVLLEREPDVCEGTSKTNSAIAHTGFDAKPGTLESKLLADSRERWPDLVEQLGVPYLPCGAVMAAVTDEEWRIVQEEVLPTALKNGVDDVALLTREEVIDRMPEVSSEVRGGLLVPREGLIDPFWLTRAYAEAAIGNGAQVQTSAEVTHITYNDSTELFTVETADGRVFAASYVVNAAGLWSDDVARLIGDDSFRITPRKGEFVLSEEELALPHILLPVPNRISKGILVTPIVFGGYLLGPTADDVEDKFDRATTQEGLSKVIEGTAKIYPRSTELTSIRQFAGLRAVSSTGGFIVGPSPANSAFYHVAGIRSTGISVSPGLGAHVANDMASQHGWAAREDWHPEVPVRVADEPRSEEIVCLCRTITRGEIEDALASPLPPTTVDGVKRRTGACLGDCQGNLCMPEIIRILAERNGTDYTDVVKHIRGSRLTVSTSQSAATKPEGSVHHV